MLVQLANILNFKLYFSDDKEIFHNSLDQNNLNNLL